MNRETQLTIQPKEKEVVFLSTQDISKKSCEPITTSLLVAEKFDKPHNKVLRDIRTLHSQLENTLTKQEISLYKIGQSNYINTRGKEYAYYNMNEAFFMLLVMGYNTPKALKMKKHIY